MKENNQELLNKIDGKKPFFLLTIGNTETAKIKDISAAGKNPKMTDYTPVADAEYLYYNACKSIEGLPISPNGIPTPAILSKACFNLLNPNFLTIKTGLNVETPAPMLDIQSKPGKNIRNEVAVQKPKKIYNDSKLIGENLSNDDRYFLLGESIAGGTTTALGVLRALGYEGMVSSSLKDNPINLKNKVIKEGLENSNISIGSLTGKPFEAIKKMGDPVIPAIAGLAAGLDSFTILSGGTQMSAVAAVLGELEELDNIVIGTTKWIIEDKSNNLTEIASEIGLETYHSKIGFSNSKYEGLRAYEKGIVKEGVGAGGLILSSELKFDKTTIKREIEDVYKEIV